MNIDDRLARYLGQTPEIADAAFVAPDATVLGDVTLGPQSSVWYGAILRGDINSIRIGAATNLQDGVIVHLVLHGRYPYWKSLCGPASYYADCQ